MVGVILVEIVDCLLEGNHSLHAKSLVEGEVGLVSYTVFCCGIDDILVECEYSVVVVEKMLRHLLKVCIETHAEKTLLSLNLLNQLLSVHNI